MTMLFFANVFLCGALCALALALSATGAALRNASPTGLPVLGGGLGLAASAFTPLAAWGVTNGVEGFPFWGLQTSLFLESLIPLFFWFGAEALFQDDFRWRPKHLLGAGAALLSLANVVQLPPSGTALFADTPTGHAIVNLFKALNLLFVALGLRATFMGCTTELAVPGLEPLSVPKSFAFLGNSKPLVVQVVSLEEHESADLHCSLSSKHAPEEGQPTSRASSALVQLQGRNGQCTFSSTDLLTHAGALEPVEFKLEFTVRSRQTDAFGRTKETRANRVHKTTVEAAPSRATP